MGKNHREYICVSGIKKTNKIQPFKKNGTNDRVWCNMSYKEKQLYIHFIGEVVGQAIKKNTGF